MQVLPRALRWSMARSPGEALMLMQFPWQVSGKTDIRKKAVSPLVMNCKETENKIHQVLGLGGKFKRV